MKFNKQTDFYQGKVRDVFTIDNKWLVMVATDRISAFDVILPKTIPHKGQVLNQCAKYFLDTSRDIVRNWLIHSPHPNVSIGIKAEAYPVEIVVRGYLAGHACRVYQSGLRTICGVELPEGLKENAKLPNPIITPTTKAHKGHDEDISREEIISRGLVNKEEYEKIEEIALKLFNRGTKMAKEKGLLLVDTKYEFGKYNDDIILIDEIHTPDSSRYFYLENYEENQVANLPQRQLSKEFVRKWLIERGFQGTEGEVVPEIPSEWINEISSRYIELYEVVTGRKFEKCNDTIIEDDINKFLGTK